MKRNIYDRPGLYTLLILLFLAAMILLSCESSEDQSGNLVKIHKIYLGPGEAPYVKSEHVSPIFARGDTIMINREYFVIDSVYPGEKIVGTKQ